MPEIGRRPVVVLTRDPAIPRLRRVLVAPCTTRTRGLPSEVVLEAPEDPAPEVAVAGLDWVEAVSVGSPMERLGRLSDERMRRVCAAPAIALDCAP